MAKPTILAVDDDPALRAPSRATSAPATAPTTASCGRRPGAEALTQLSRLALQDRRVALVVSDQRMPGMTGIEMLEEVRSQAPDAKLLLLTAYADTDVAIKAINDIGLDYYLVKPWDPPSERLYPVDRRPARRLEQRPPAGDQEVRVVGHPWAERTYEVKTFLTRNHVPYRWLDVEHDDEAARLYRPRRGDRPSASRSSSCRTGTALASPSNLDLAECARPAHPRRAAALRPLHRRRRARRSRGRRVRRVRGAVDGRRRAGRARGAGRPERVDRELPRLPQGTVRRRPDPPGGRPGGPVRGGDGARRATWWGSRPAARSGR